VIKFLLTVGLKWPRAALACITLLVIASGLLVQLGGLRVSTSRTSLVTSPHQSRLFDYYSAFGRSELAVLVVSGDSADERRQFVDHFETELGKLPEFERRVLGKVTLDTVAETLLVWRPELAQLLPKAGAALQPGVDPWVSWAEAAERRLSSELEGPNSNQDANPKPIPAQAGKGLGRLADALKALRQALASSGQLSLGELGGLNQGASAFDERGYLVGGKGAYHLVLIFPALQSDEGRELKPAVERIRAARDRALSALPNAKVHADLTGAPALAVDELKSLQDSSRITSLISTVGIFLLLMLVFRSLRHVAVLLLPLLAGMVISLGVVVLAYGGLNLVTSAFMSVLLGLGIEFGVHLLHRYSEARVEGEDMRPALKTALLSDGPAVALGACTTAAAFLSTTATKFAAFAQLGVITAAGLFVTLVCTIVGFPALLPILAGKRKPNMHELVGLSTVLNVVGRRARWVLAIAGIATLLSVVSLLVKQPGFNGRTFDFLPAHAESYRGLKRIEESGTPPLDTHFMVGSFDQARELTNKLRHTPEVALVQSPSDLLPPETPERIASIKQAVAELADYVPKIPASTAADGPARLAAFTRLADALDELSFAMRQANLDGSEATRAAHELNELGRWLSTQPEAGAVALNRVGKALETALTRAVTTARHIAERGHYAPTDLPAVFVARFVSKDGTRLALHAYPAGNVEEEGFATRFGDRLRALDPNVAGTALNLLPHERYITDGFRRAAGYSLVLMALAMLLMFRRVGDTILALLPVILGSIWMLALMRPLGIQFTAANMVALPLLLGICLDSGVHIVHRSLEGPGTARLEALVQGTGTAVSVAALTNLMGFASLMAADYRAMQGLGFLLSLGIALSLLASVLVLPALLVVLGRAGLSD